MCRIDGCEREAYRDDLCRRHHYRLYTYGDPLAGGPERDVHPPAECTVEGCGRPYSAKGYCTKHYVQWKRTGTPTPDVPPPRLCSILGCDKPHRAHGFCGKHYQRWRDNGDPTVVKIAPHGAGTIDRKGYRLVSRPGHPNAQANGKIREHRLVMSEMLGRPLRDDENVHHRNGIRHQNHPDNLELWVSIQPCGQTVPDLLAFAREIIDRYGDIDDTAPFTRPSADCHSD